MSPRGAPTGTGAPRVRAFGRRAVPPIRGADLSEVELTGSVLYTGGA